MSPISGVVGEVLDLFENELAGLRFGDLDQAAMEEAAAQVRQRAEEQARAEAALQTAQQALHESQEALQQRCQRALAYARIYAEGDADLLQRLDGISQRLPRGGRTEPEGPRPAPRRGRRPAASGGLFVEVTSDAPPPANGVSH